MAFCLWPPRTLCTEILLPSHVLGGSDLLPASYFLNLFFSGSSIAIPIQSALSWDYFCEYKNVLSYLCSSRLSLPTSPKILNWNLYFIGLQAAKTSILSLNTLWSKIPDPTTALQHPPRYNSDTWLLAFFTLTNGCKMILEERMPSHRTVGELQMISFCLKIAWYSGTIILSSFTSPLSLSSPQ